MNDIYNRKDEEFTVIGEVPESLKLNDPLYKEGFQAGAASRDAEVAEHIEEITALKEVIKHGDAQRERDMELAGEERDQLRAQINVLRELVIHSTDYRLGNPAYEASIATTPEQSLFEYRNKVIEDCAVKADALANCEENTDGYRNGAAWCAEAIRAMKEQL